MCNEVSEQLMHTLLSNEVYHVLQQQQQQHVKEGKLSHGIARRDVYRKDFPLKSGSK